MQHKLQYLYGFDLRGALAGHFGWPPTSVRFLNDAAAYLVGEIAAGAARGVSRVVGITLGTGVGSALVRDVCRRANQRGEPLVVLEGSPDLTAADLEAAARIDTVLSGSGTDRGTT